MANGQMQDVLYGQFGTAEYDFENRSWLYSRLPIPATPLQPFENPQILVPASEPAPLIESQPQHEWPSIRYDKQIKTLLEGHTSLQPSANLLRRLAHVSETIQDAVHRYDPNQGSLIANGEVISKLTHRPISVVATVTGECKSDLLVFQVGVQKHVWNDARRTCVPTRMRDEGLWTGRSGPIQQVLFRRPLDHSTILLAVRLLNVTKIFRPVHEKSPPEIDLKLLSTITLDQTGYFGHADVAFNPWFVQQIALVDQAGHWTVIEYQSRKLEKVIHTWKGWAAAAPDVEPSLIYDGWARITWIASLATIAVCTRATLTLFDISTPEPTTIHKIDFASTTPLSCVVDLLLLPGRVDLLSILTSTHILIYQVTQRVSGETFLRRIFHTRHFQNPADLSLRLSSWVDAESTAILIFTRANCLVWQYMCQISESGYVRHGTPVQIAIPPSILPHETQSYIVELGFQPIKWTAMPLLQRSDHPVTNVHDRQHQVCMLIVLLSNGAMYSCVYDPTKARIADMQHTSTRWQDHSRDSRRRGQTSHQFVVADDIDDSPGDDAHRGEPVSRRVRRPRSPKKPKDRLLDLETIGHRLQQGPPVVEPLSLALSRVRRLLREPSSLEIPSFQTLANHFSTELTFRDAGEVGTQLQSIMTFAADPTRGLDVNSDQPERPWHLTAETMSLPLFVQNSFPENAIDLSAAYSNMVAAWIKPLDEAISPRIRLNKEQLIRRIACDVVLSQHLLRINPGIAETETAQPSQEDESSHPLSWELPVRSGVLDRQRLAVPDMSSPVDTQVLPTPSPSATTSTTTASSYLASIGSAEINRLSQYTTFSKPAPLALPRSLNNVLSHWTIGDDPTDYDWLATSRLIAQREEAADEVLTDKDRRRARRRAERHIRRQRKEAAASQAAQVASSQAPEIFSASQPTTIATATTTPSMGSHRIAARSSPQQQQQQQAAEIPRSSQSMMLDPRSIGASQILPGRFGGRPPPKKKRKSGF